MCLQSNPDFKFSNPKGELNLPLEVLESVLDQAPPTMTNIGLSSYRETVLQPRVLDYFNLAIKRGLSAVFETSGVIYKEEFFLDCMSRGIKRILVSLNAPTRETYKMIHGRDNFDRVVRNMEALINLRDKYNFDTEIHTHIMMYKECIEVYREFRQKWADRLNKVYLQALCNWGDYRWTNDCVRSRGLTEIRPIFQERKPCPSLFEVLILGPDGNYYLCPMAYKQHVIGKPVAALGNVRTTTLAEAWERVDYYRDLHLQGRYDEIECCRNCNGWQAWIMYVDDLSERQIDDLINKRLLPPKQAPVLPDTVGTEPKPGQN